MNGVRRILFVRTDRIGDALMNLPAVRSLRLAHPKAWITLLAGEAASELFRGHPDLDEVMTFDEKKARSVSGRWALARRLRAARFDLAVVSNPSKYFHFAVWAAGIPVRAGHARKWPFFLNRRVKPESLEGLHEVDRNLKLAECASGSPWDGRIELPADEGSAKRVRERLAPLLERYERVVVVHPGTTHLKKRWLPERFGALCEKILRDPNTGVLLIGGKEEREVSRQIRRLAPDAADWTGQTSLRELAALFGHPRVAALVSSDSGPVHIAWIAGTPAVALYAADLPGSDPARWGPRDGASVAIHRPMADIPAEEVFAAVRRLPARQKAAV